jgi:hypothetical protein
MTPDEDRTLRDSVPERWKRCKSPIGAVQSYIAEMEHALNHLGYHPSDEAYWQLLGQICPDDETGEGV